jgi:hypothetical protein
MLKVGSLGTTSARAGPEKGARFLQAKHQCHGDPLVHPQNEDYWEREPDGPRGVATTALREDDDGVPPTQVAISSSSTPTARALLRRARGPELSPRPRATADDRV